MAASEPRSTYQLICPFYGGGWAEALKAASALDGVQTSKQEEGIKNLPLKSKILGENRPSWMPSKTPSRMTERPVYPIG